MPLGIAEVRGILPRGGTILGSSRTNPFKIDGGVERIKANLAELGVDALVAIGGEDTLGVATKLHDLGVNVVGVPKTIDNDLSATDYTFGFDTAVNIAMEAIDRLHTTAESHHRTLVVEVMGRHAGWIALHAGLAGGANVILLPERNFDVEQVAGVRREALPARSTRRSSWSPRARSRSRARWCCTTRSSTRSATSASAASASGWPSRSRRKTGKEARTVVLGHIQRGGTPTAFDRVLATRFGLHAIDAVHDGDFGKMVALRGTDIVRVPLVEATRRAQDRADGALHRGRGLLRQLTSRRQRRFDGPGRDIGAGERDAMEAGMHTVAVIGAGKIGELLLSGLLRAGWPVERLLATARRPERAEELAERYGVRVVDNADRGAPRPTCSRSRSSRRTPAR